MLNDYEVQTNLFTSMGNLLISGLPSNDLEDPVCNEVR